MYTLKEIEQGKGLYTDRQAVIWLIGPNKDGKQQFSTTERGQHTAGEIVGYAMAGESIEWV